MKYVTSDLILVLYYFNEQGKNVHIVDLYVVPTWKLMDPLPTLPVGWRHVSKSIRDEKMLCD